MLDNSGEMSEEQPNPYGLGCFYNPIPPHHQRRRHRLVGLGQVLGLVGVRPLGPPVLAE